MSRCAVSMFMLGWVIVGPADRVAAESVLKSELSALFAEGWKPTPSEQIHASLAEHFRTARAAALNDVRPPLSFAIVQIRQRKYDDTIKTLDEVIKLDKANLPARRMKAWVLTLTKKHSAALVELENLSKLFPDLTDNAAAEEPFTNSAAFIGRMIGYLEGPGAGAVNDNQLIETKSKIWERLSTSRREAFEAGYKKVAGRFTELTQGKQQTQADAKADEDKQKVATQTKLETDKVQIEKDLAVIDVKIAKITEDEKRELSELDAQITPLTAQLADLSIRARAVQSDIAVSQANIANLLNQASAISSRRDPRDRDETQIALLINEANRQQLILSRDDGALRSIQVQAAGVNAQRQSLVNRRNTVENRAATALDGLDRQANQLRGTQKRIGFDEQKLSKPSTGFTGKVTSLSATLSALTTYDELPLEEEKQQILDSIAE